MQIKDFQQKTIEHALTKLEENNRFLVADEVGLGKTIIARGVIEALHAKKQRGEPFHVIYICSNQVLAAQNLIKLSPREEPENFSRLIFMVKEREKPSNFTISTLTPGTSFHLIKSKGIVPERAIIFRLLCETFYAKATTGEIKKLKKLLQGDCSETTWDAAIKEISAKNVTLKANINSLFVQELKASRTIENVKKYISGSKDLREVEIIVALRHAVTNIVLDHYVDADLFILDEFQRFDSLLGEKESKDPEQTEIALTARKIFDNPKHRVLLLSATPFSPYATQWDSEKGDDHLEAFDRVLQFLGRQCKEDAFGTIKNRQKEYFSLLSSRKSQLQSLADEEEFQFARKQMARSYLELLSRTERAIVEHGALVNENSVSRIVASFGEIASVVSAIKHLPEKQYTHLLVEFCKSVPYPYSFTTGYKLNESVNRQAGKHNLPRELFLPFEDWAAYTFNPSGKHAKLELLIEKAMPQGIEQHLWIPPSTLYYSTGRDKVGYSKTLIFSSWALVPRTLSVFLSYEYERRLANLNPEKLAYFPKENKKGVPERRRPTPVLVFAADAEIDASSLAALLYPCRYLAQTLDFTPNPDATLEDLLKAQSNLAELDFKKFERSVGNQQDSYWNWYALFYLDQRLGVGKEFDNWFKGHWLLFDPEQDSDETEADAAQDRNDKGKTKFLKGIQERLVDFRKKNTFRIPHNLPATLAIIGTASPAICAYRALRKNYRIISNNPKPGKDEYTDKEFVYAASLIALGFISLFNKPESIQAIRASAPKEIPYWQQCLHYCALHNLQAMLDEYVYLLAEAVPSMFDTAEHIFDMMRIKTNPLEASFTDTKGKHITKRTRCHFAVDYGRQKVSTSSGDQRMVSVRDAFNSPFRPFVLTSTSIGQEGLDFHWYCRNIFHWNLPHNPINIEQREGRINRYKSHVLRLNHAMDFNSSPTLNRTYLKGKNLWQQIFIAAATKHKNQFPESCELIPYWHMNPKEAANYQIERFVPLYAFSSDEEKYRTIIKVLSVYRMTFGQPNQEQALSVFLEETAKYDARAIREIVHKICIDLAPISQ